MNLNFAENFKNLRKEKNITQEKVAEVLGVSAQSISRWEIGICYPDLELLPSIANYFGVSIDALLSNDTDAKKKDAQIFFAKINTLSCDTTEEIDFVMEYCKKYPDVDYYAYKLIGAIRDYAAGDKEKTEKYYPIAMKNVQRLLDTRFRTGVIHYMSAMCPENELEKWLDMAPYAGFSRRCCLVTRARTHNDWNAEHIQTGIETFEAFAIHLDRRCPDKLGSAKKLEFQRSILRTVESFGENGEVPDGWKMFYAYKQLVYAACLFAQKKTDDGWKNFDSAIEKCKYVFSTEAEWLDVGGRMFSEIKVSKDWSSAVDENGNEHKLFGITNISFYDMEIICDLLTDPRWSWFNSVRETEKYQAAVEWVKTAEEKQRAEL